MCNDVADGAESDPRRRLLQEQLGITWSFAEDVVLPEIDHERCVWEPSDHVVRCGAARTAGWRTGRTKNILRYRR